MPTTLQGKTLDQTLHDSLQLVPNPHSDPGITQLNRIRWARQAAGDYNCQGAECKDDAAGA